MITIDVQRIKRAHPHEFNDFSTVHLETAAGAAKLYLPKGTADAVAACINVAVAAGAQAEALRTMGVDPESVALEAAK